MYFTSKTILIFNSCTDKHQQASPKQLDQGEAGKDWPVGGAGPGLCQGHGQEGVAGRAPASHGQRHCGRSWEHDPRQDQYNLLSTLPVGHTLDNSRVKESPLTFPGLQYKPSEILKGETIYNFYPFIISPTGSKSFQTWRHGFHNLYSQPR